MDRPENRETKNMTKRCTWMVGSLAFWLLFMGDTLADESRPSVSATAQDTGGATRSTIEVTRAMIRSERQKIVAQALPLSQEEAEKFWPLYRDFSVELSKLNDRRAELISKYAELYPNVPENEAHDMLDTLLEIQSSELQLKQKYVPRFRKVLPEVKVTRYFQLENKLDAILRLELAQAIPLML